jgi:Glycosyl transferase family 2
MNILIQDYYNNTAEMELKERIRLACRNLGWTAQFASWEKNSSGSTPDIALALHQVNPRMFDVPTFGCLWNPPDFFGNSKERIANLLSYDGFLFGGPSVEGWFSDLLFSVQPKKFETGFIVPSVHNFILPPNSFEQCDRVAYCGTNWDKVRHQNFLSELDQRNLAAFIGPQKSWSQYKNVIEKVIPFDGESMIRELSNFSAVLCLSSPAHRKWGLPSMRVFETIAAGSLPICDQNQFFIREFPEALFISDDSPSKTQIEEVAKHVQWIKDNPAAAKKKVETLQATLRSKFLLETMLEPLAGKLEKVRKTKFFVSGGPVSTKKVQIILRYGSQDPKRLAASLETLAKQTFKNIDLIAIKVFEETNSETVLESYQGRLSIKKFKSIDSGSSTALSVGLSELSGDYFAVLNEGDCLATNHVATLVDLLEKFTDIGVAHSSRVTTERTIERDGSLNFGSVQGFTHIRRDALLELNDRIPDSGFLARRSLLTSRELMDPALGYHEVFYLLLLLSQCAKFKYTGEATVLAYESTIPPSEAQESALDKINRRLYGHLSALGSPYSAKDGTNPLLALDADHVELMLKLGTGIRILRKLGVVKLLKIAKSALKRIGFYQRISRQ